MGVPLSFGTVLPVAKAGPWYQMKSGDSCSESSENAARDDIRNLAGLQFVGSVPLATAIVDERPLHVGMRAKV